MSIASLMAGAVIGVGSHDRAATKAIQLALRAAGAEIVCDGRFGSITDAAVRCFQAAHHLDIDGVFGLETAKALDVVAVGDHPAPSGYFATILSRHDMMIGLSLAARSPQRSRRMRSPRTSD